MTRTIPVSAVAVANAAAFLAPASFSRRASAVFVTPRARSQTDRGRELLHAMETRTFAGPLGQQRAYIAGSGPRVFFQHGWEADSADLASHADALMTAGFEVVLIDGPAHGASDGRKTSLVDFAAGLVAAAEAFGQPHAVIAHSMGAPSTVIATRRGGITPKAFVALAAPRSLPENVEFQGRSAGLTRRAVRLMLEGIERRLGEPIEHFDINRDAGAMTAKALFVHGTGDQIVPASASKAMANAWPRSELALFEGLGHRGVLRDTAVIGRVTRFLEDSRG